ncbi:NAD(P)-dependent oxidoreductase [Rhodococcus sp. HM1]|uniref:NAD-dependent epimerase/dehydratase family protein n=1 Tax=unclassified Rhodococcus (in: high G+C Gram-positive bacteria) TaxID=192944 RepID=UPI0018CF6A20|nr:MULTISPECIES: NAD(P)-dependent oxidoreductase [unclassified Rhodococcus (in: high G+C Gram-positive bacteria)]MBH0119645.1 NAD(P)-dependent oxidoreductase [Rhodococcus sp. CX]MCK8671052.1 NAD(P)-dependent oxidoreductase [Rhodococcus sp. HM1]
MPAPTWVVGSGGLLGSWVTRELRRRDVPVTTSTVPWEESEQARSVLLADADRFVRSTRGGRWRVAWCAGAGVNGTTPEAFAAENDLLRDVLDGLARASGGSAENGTVFHASSAGGVYAAATGAPHSEHTPTAPLGPYGHAKLAAEAVIADFARETGATAVIGRFANLYGPGQNLDKPQGLISHLCRGYLTGTPVSIYVSMDTLRDYLFVADAGEMVADALDRAEAEPGGVSIKIFASGRSVTIGAILGACRTVFRRRPNVVLASSPLASVQGRDLRLRSVVWPELDRRSHRPLPAGIAATLESTRRAMGQSARPSVRSPERA